MKDKIKIFAVFTAVIFSLVTVIDAKAQDTVKVYNWSDYIDESLISQFEEETGLKVIYDVFDSNEVLESKLLAGSTGYDVVVPSATFLSRQIQAGVFRKLDKAKLSNYDNLWDIIIDRTVKYDPGSAYSINYMWGTTALGINVNKVKEVLGEDADLNSWALIFDPKNMEKLAACGVHILDAPAEVFPAALNFLGKNPDSHDIQDIAITEPLLAAIRPYVRKFHSSEYVNALANGDICVAHGYSGDIFQARDRAYEADNGVEIEYIIPKEGALMWFDQMAIPTDAPNVEGAHMFMDFILRPESAALASNYVYYANGNKASQPLLDAEVIDDPAIYPDADTLKVLYTTTTYPPKTQRFVTRLWTKVKTNR